jgi:toxin ParE1/3/4
MAYPVNMMPRAERGRESIYAAIDADQSDAALRWFTELQRAIFNLEEMPTRCPVTPEDARLRHLLFGRKPHVYRVIYQIFEKRKKVDVLHIRHGARQAFESGDLK